MEPKVISVSERKILGPNQQIMNALVVTYTVGSYGPFTLTTNAIDLGNGNALSAMRQFAATLATLPTGS